MPAIVTIESVKTISYDYNVMHCESFRFFINSRFIFLVNLKMSKLLDILKISCHYASHSIIETTELIYWIYNLES